MLCYTHKQVSKQESKQETCKCVWVLKTFNSDRKTEKQARKREDKEEEEECWMRDWQSWVERYICWENLSI